MPNKANTNQLKMPFAEWLYRMHEAGLPLPARFLAINAAVFQITNNDELAELSGMASDKKVAGRTYDKYKTRLLKEGWVIIERRAGGRGIGIQVGPAYHETPVKFTDLSARNPSKYCGGIEEEDTPANIAPVSPNTPATFDETAEITPANPAPLSPARVTHAESNNINNNNNLQTNYACASEAASAHEEQPSADLVHVNGAAIHGPNFKLDFKAIDMAAALLPMPSDRARQIATILAYDWAANGTKPQNPMAQVRAAMRSDFQQGQIQELRVSRATAGRAAADPAESRSDRMRRFAREERERQEAKKGKRT